MPWPSRTPVRATSRPREPTRARGRGPRARRRRARGVTFDQTGDTLACCPRGDSRARLLRLRLPSRPRGRRGHRGPVPAGDGRDAPAQGALGGQRHRRGLSPAGQADSRGDQRARSRRHRDARPRRRPRDAGLGTVPHAGGAPGVFPGGDRAGVLPDWPDVLLGRLRRGHAVAHERRPRRLRGPRRTDRGRARAAGQLVVPGAPDRRRSPGAPAVRTPGGRPEGLPCLRHRYRGPAGSRHRGLPGSVARVVPPRRGHRLPAHPARQTRRRRRGLLRPAHRRTGVAGRRHRTGRHPGPAGVAARRGRRRQGAPRGGPRGGEARLAQTHRVPGLQCLHPGAARARTDPHSGIHPPARTVAECRRAAADQPPRGVARGPQRPGRAAGRTRLLLGRAVPLSPPAVRRTGLGLARQRRDPGAGVARSADRVSRAGQRRRS